MKNLKEGSLSPHTLIEGVQITKIERIPDERGEILHMIRADDPIFKKFGEIYFSRVYPGVVKGWHLHKKMTLNYAVPEGMIKLVLYDDRSLSTTRGMIMELFVGESRYELVTIPPNVWNGFKGIGTKPALVANCSTEPHDPSEIERMDPIGSKIPYDWNIKWR